MSSSGPFVAQMLETSAAGYAGLSSSLLFERVPDIAKRYEPEGFASWKSQLQQWLLDLSASVHTGEPALFESRMLWNRRTFVAREAPTEDLLAALTAMRDILKERLPADSADAVVPVVDRAIRAVADAQAGTEDEPEPGEAVGRSALSYLKTILEGRPRQAIEQVLEAVNGGASVREAYLDVLIPAQREAGRLWHAGELSIAEEHVITATTQRAMAVLCQRAGSPETGNKTVLLACVAGNVHDIGVRAITDFFEIAGWQAINLGSDVPTEEIARSVQFFDADVVVLAATLDPDLKMVERAIERIRALEDRRVKVIVGGLAFEKVPELWRSVGADGYSMRLEDTEPLAATLAG